MKTKQIILAMLAIGVNCYLACADGLTYNPNHLSFVRRGTNTYTYMLTTNGLVYVNPGEFWNGVWKEDTNGWRVQLRVYWETNYWVPRERVMYPTSTNLILLVEWGSAVKNSRYGYYLPPNGKFAKLELRDVNGNVIPPNPNAGTNLLLRNLESKSSISCFPDISVKPIYGTNLPTWADPSSGSLVADFPKTISTNVYPRMEYSGAAGKIDSDIMGEIPLTMTVTNFPPLGINALKLDEIYSVTNEGDYTLTVQPVLYKKRIETNLLDRVDLPSVTTKVHLTPNAK